MTSPTDGERPSGRWFRDVYRDAVWESECLSAEQKAVLETYARHARTTEGDKGPDADLAWLTYPRLMAKAGIRRRAKVPALVDGLVAAGWLVLVHEASRRSTIYRLAIPAGGAGGGTTDQSGGGSDGGTTDTAGSSDGGTTDETARSSDGGTTVVPQADHGSSTSAAGSSNGGTQPLRPLQEPPLTSTSLSVAVDPSVPATREDENRERDETATPSEVDEQPTQPATVRDYAIRLLTSTAYGHTKPQAEYLVDALTDRWGIFSPKWWDSAHGNGSLRDQIRELIDNYQALQMARPAAPRGRQPAGPWQNPDNPAVAYAFPNPPAHHEGTAA